jgi:hypothetical protein
MKAKAVSALRSERGLRRVSGAEPQVVGLTPQTTDERKTDTMKKYILRDPKPVQPQKASRPNRPQPMAPGTVCRLQLEWIVAGFTAQSFWTRTRRWIAFLESLLGFGLQTGL